jgi:hypothetical protein
MARSVRSVVMPKCAAAGHSKPPSWATMPKDVVRLFSAPLGNDDRWRLRL